MREKTGKGKMEDNGGVVMEVEGMVSLQNLVRRQML